MVTGIGTPVISLYSGTTGLRATWTKANKKYKKTTKGKGSKKKTVYEFKEYQVTWYYLLPNLTKWLYEKSTITSWDSNNSTFTIPDTATKVKVGVKLVLKKGTKTPPSFPQAVSNVYVTSGAFLPSTPSLVTPSIDEKGRVTIPISIDQAQVTSGVDEVWFNVKYGYRENGVDHISSTGTITKVPIKNNLATLVETVPVGYFYMYRVAAHSTSSNKTSTWSNFSNQFYTKSETPSGLWVETDSSSSVVLHFRARGYVEGYEAQWASEERYLGTNIEGAGSTSWNEENREVVDHTIVHYVEGLETGHSYFFRVRANSGSYGITSWSRAVPLVIGRAPGPPSIYSSKTAAEIGETVNLYWVHNSQDGSSQTQAEIELYINNDQDILNDNPVFVTNPYIEDEYQKDKTLSLPISLTANSHYDPDHYDRVYSFKDADILFWRVRTRGVYSGSSKTRGKSFRIKFEDDSTPVNVRLPDTPTSIREIRAIGGTKNINYRGYSVLSDADYSYDGRRVTIRPSMIERCYTNNTSLSAAVSIEYSYNTGGFGDWSSMKQVSMYEKPTASIAIKTGWTIDPTNPDDLAPIEEVDPVDIIDTYPIAVVMSATPETQEAISFYLTIRNAGAAYNTTNAIGEEITVGPNEAIYQAYFDKVDEIGFSAEGRANKKTVILTPSDVIFENGESYNFDLEVYMNSGLSDTTSMSEVDVYLDESSAFTPDATIIPDLDNMMAHIQVSCFDDEENPDDSAPEYDEDELNDTLTQNVLLDVYRIETDGTTTLIDSGLINNGSATVTDPHPSLDFARYRVVARKTNTAKSVSMDFEEEMGIHSLVIQWDEVGLDAFDISSLVAEEDDVDEALSQITYNRGMLVLPWNVDTSEDYKPDVSMISYIGREHPVAYYGTQKGATASWSTVIDKQDKITLFRLRKLARYMGDCYVREPSGTGYWANVQVNWSQTHNEPAIPVSITVVRVDAHSEKDNYVEEE